MYAAYALGFLDCDNISARCMLSIFQFFATKTDASVLRMLSGSPATRLLQPIADYITARGGRIHTKTGCRCASMPECGLNFSCKVSATRTGSRGHAHAQMVTAVRQWKLSSSLACQPYGCCS